MKLVNFFCVAAVVGIGSGCDSLLGADCPDIIYPGIAASVRDASTGMPAARGVAGVARTGGQTFSFSVEPETPTVPALHVYAFIPPGVYTVELRKSGYHDWTAENVRVRKAANGCYNETTQLEAALERST